MFRFLMRRASRAFQTILVLCCALAAGNAQVPGISTNMVSGTQWPGGDPFLQRQNEPSMAVSSRNPMHVVAGDNDYRTVDLPFVQGAEETGDAWLGFFSSYDGGSTWTSVLVPGFPQDTSQQGSACPVFDAVPRKLHANAVHPNSPAPTPCSPIRGYQAAADPGVRSGPNGMFLYSGLAFKRDQSSSAIFLARYVDDNNVEGGGSIRYLDTQVVAYGYGLDSDSPTFLDKPSIAVDIPRGNGTCSIPNSDGTFQTIPAFNIYVAWTQFLLPESNNNGQIMFAQSQDCGVTWNYNPISTNFANNLGNYITPLTNQGAQIAIDPNTGNVFVGWRIFANEATGDSDTISVEFLPLAADGQIHPEAPANVLFQNINPFDQGTTPTAFRTNDYPSLAMDNNSNLYVAWSQRTSTTNRDARIELSTIKMSYYPCSYCLEGPALPNELSSADVFSPYLIDSYTLPGHQIMPALAFSAGKLTAAWYDFRDDDEEFIYTSTNNPANQYTFTLQPDGSFTFGAQFAPYIFDPSGAGLRHTVDVRAAQGVPSAYGVTFQNQPNTSPATTSVLVSQYAYGTPAPQPDALQSAIIEQLEFDAPDLPLFEQGNAPFIGDYIDVAGPTLINDPVVGWRFNNLATDPDYTHVVWADNRNVVPPADGNWANYTPVNLSAGTTSTYDPTQTLTQSCSPGQTGMRNQDIYTATLSPGIIMGALGNTKPLSTTFARQFSVTLQNPTTQSISYRLTIPTQPPGGSASFVESFPPNQPLTTLDITIPALTTAARSVFVTSSNPTASIVVNAQQISAPGAPNVVTGGLNSSVTLNPDSTTPTIQNPNILNPNILNPNILNAEVYNPNILNPTIANPNILNPNILNPNILNPTVLNVTVANPNILNPNILNPNILNPNILNPNILNPNILNPNILNPNILNTSISDASYTITNTGNTASTYSLQLLQNQAPPNGVTLQAIVSGVYTTPVANGCTLTVEAHYVPLVNDPSPTLVLTPAGLNTNALTNPTTDSFTLAPGETAIITIRDYDTTTNNDAAALAHYNPLTGITPVIIAAAPNTGSPSNSPAISLTISTSALANGSVDASYSQPALQAFGGTGTGYTWSLPAGTQTAPNALPMGLALNPSTGLISGTPTATFSGTVQVQVTDSGNYTAFKVFNLTVTAALPATITPNTGTTPQSATVGVKFTNALAVTVKDLSSNPLAGTNVVFTAPSTAASGTFSNGMATITVPTDSNGNASAPFTANAIPGGYGVTAAVGQLQTSFSLTNIAATQNVTINVPAGLSFTLNSVNYTGSQTVPLAPGPYILATTSPQSLGAGSQAVFTGWSDNGAISHTITVASAALTITATFKTQYQLTNNAGTGGTVSPAGVTFYDPGTVVPVTATPSASYAFSNWTGPVASTSAASTTVTVNAATSITANFQPGVTQSSATYLPLDSSTRGNWTGTYGADGYIIANDVSKLPAYATVSFTGQSTWTWASNTTDPRALQASSGSSTHIASTYYAGGTFNINVDLTDGNMHKVALYLLDWDTTSRTETISILDAATHAVLSSQSFSGFQNGQYAAWNLTGNVIIQVNQTGGISSAVSGIFFSTTSLAPPVISQVTASNITSNSATITWITDQASSSQVNYGATTAYGMSSTPNPTQVTSHSVTLTSLAAGTPYNYAVLSTGSNGVAAQASNFTFTTSATPATSNSATYNGIDASTQGAWTGTYGADGYIIADDATNAPSYATASITGASSWIFQSPSTDPRALQTSSGSSTRIASAYYAGGTFNITMNLTDGATHKVALYLLDWDTTTRSETISILDAVTKSVLSSQSFAHFQNGEYASWNITGNVIIQVTQTGGISSAVSAIFFGGAASVAPPNISQVTSTNVTANSAIITWQTDQSSTSQVAYGLTTAYGTSTTPDPTLVTKHSVNLTNLTPGQTYNYQVLSSSSLGSPATSGNYTFKTSTTSNSATYKGTDVTTRGAWTGIYGADGYIIANDISNPAPYAAVNIGGASTWTFASSTTDPRALQVSSGSSNRIASTYYAGGTFNINVNLTDGGAHKIALYLLDYDTTTRTETISILDASTKAVLNTQSFAQFQNGQYGSWDVTGNVIIQVTQTGGISSAVSGIFFGPP